MKLAMAQIQMGNSAEENLRKSLHYIKSAGEAGADLIFFPGASAIAILPSI
ncbi:MAG: hypothetical protein LUH36_08170 [Oscillospiraceae bacterium]|nr:hypothetical protein [Oscillospiraceae bacterium]